MPDYRLTDRTVYVDNQARKRSGHMGHALVEYAPGKIMAFNSNVDYDRVTGHSGYGWMEYRRSADGGRTWDGIKTVPYSVAMYEEGVHTALCEKAVLNGRGEVVCFWQITDAAEEIACEPWSEPTCNMTPDGGETWSEARTVSTEKGRIYDALSRDHSVWFAMLANEHFIGCRPEHRFLIYRSDDDGDHFDQVFEPPISAMGCGYCAMEFREDCSLIFYAYDSNDETRMPYAVSPDGGKTWTETGKTYVAKKIRNPQVVRAGKTWFLHGRNGGSGDGLVLYTSNDGVNWDDGVMVDRRPVPGTGYYSNNLRLGGAFRGTDAREVLIQYSHVYDQNRVNVIHIRVTDFDR